MDLVDAAIMARTLMTRHGLAGWTLAWDRARTRAGVCRPRRQQIGLSAVLTSLHDEEQVRDTVLHEIAHALVGVAEGHGRVWQAKAVELGCSPRRCFDRDAPVPPPPWVGRCSAGHEVTAYRAPLRVRSCGRCAPTFTLSAMFIWRRHGVIVRMPPRFVAELTALVMAIPMPDDEGVRPTG